MVPERLGIIGLGAIGGSLAWRAAVKGVPHVIGYAASARDRAEALRVGAVTEVAHSAEQLVRAADLTVLAVPPQATVALLERLAPLLRERRGWMTDVASVKRPVVERAGVLGLEDHFAGSHPFAGTHATGFAAAKPDMLSGATVYVTPVARGDGAAREIADFWRRVVDAQPVVIHAAEHDAWLAWTSHLPQAVASALAVALARHGPSGASYGSGALSTTRVAASGVEMWCDILLMNREQILAALPAVGDALEELRNALAAGDAAAVAHWLETGAAWRRGVGA